MERKLASIRVIADLLPIPDADAIETAIVEGFVFKSHDSDFQFKIINDKFLLKGGN